MKLKQYLKDGISRGQEGILTLILFIANIATDILVCVHYYDNWTDNKRDETNLFSIMIIGAVLITTIFQLHAIFMKYQDITSQLLQQSNISCHFLFIFFYSLCSMIGFTQPLFLLIIWKLKQMESHLNWAIFRQLSECQAIYQSSIGGTLQIYLLITEKQYTNPLLIISIIISVLSYSINICTKYKPLTKIEYKVKFKFIGKIKFGPMPYYSFYAFYMAIVSDYLIRSIMLSLCLNLMINSHDQTMYYLLYLFFIIPYLIIYVLYFLRVYFEYQVKFNWLAHVFTFNQNAIHQKDIRNFYLLKGIYYPILTLIRGCNSGWMFILMCDPKQITESFIKKCSRDQTEADQLKVNTMNNWSYVKGPIYALCRINLTEIVIKYLIHIILLIIIAVISYNDKNINNFNGWFIIMCLSMVIFIISFWFWLEIVWQYPVIYEHVFIDKISRKHIKPKAIKHACLNSQLPQPTSNSRSIELSPVKPVKISGTKNEEYQE
eukprot:415770_1